MLIRYRLTVVEQMAILIIEIGIHCLPRRNVDVMVSIAWEDHIMKKVVLKNFQSGLRFGLAVRPL